MQAKLIKDSIANGIRICTFVLVYPRLIHSELMTHRVFSRNAASSRAIPTAAIIQNLRDDPAEIVWWGKNISGMQAKEELKGWQLKLAKFGWATARELAILAARFMGAVGLHKQIANRVLEPFQNIRVVVTSTEWNNFFNLRNHCYSEDTEVLTENGWKFIKDITRGDTVISLNTSNRKLETASVLDTVSWVSEGKALSLKGQTVDLIISHEHNQLVESNKKLELVKANSLMDTAPTLYKTCLPDVYDSSSKDFALGKIMGFYLGNGWTSFNEATKNYNVFFCKGGDSGDLIITEYISLFKVAYPQITCRTYSKHSVHHIEISNKELFNTYSHLGHSTTKSIPPECWEYSPSYLRGLFDGLLDADSNIHAKSGGLKYYTSSKQLADDFQRLALVVGASATLAVDNRVGTRSNGISPTTNRPYDITTQNIGYRLSVNWKRNSPKLISPAVEIPYQGQFNCLSLNKNHTLYVRRNGKAVWSGNCDAQPEFRQLAILMDMEMKRSEPQILFPGEWHIPYITSVRMPGRIAYLQPEIAQTECIEITLEQALKISASMAAQESYRKSDPSLAKAEAIWERLVGSMPVHASPTEHQAMVPNESFNGQWPTGHVWEKGVTHQDREGNYWSGNFRGYIQHRQLLSNHDVKG